MALIIVSISLENENTCLGCELLVNNFRYDQESKTFCRTTPFCRIGIEIADADRTMPTRPQACRDKQATVTLMERCVDNALAALSESKK